MSGVSSRSSGPRGGHVELIVSRAGHPDRRLLLKPGVLRLGRAEDNDLVLPDIGVSRRHARIIVDDTGVTIEDLGSGNGTLFQGRPVRKKRIEDNDTLNIDPFNLRFRVRPDAPGRARRVDSDTLGGPRLILITDTDVAASVYPIPATGLTMGRATNQGVVLNDPGASRQHAILFPRQGGCWLQDNRSANGTFVNDERVYQHMVKHGDVLRIGHTMFRLDMGAPGMADDPLSELWDESGIYPRKIQDDDAPADPLPPPPPTTFSPSMPSALPIPPNEPTLSMRDAETVQHGKKAGSGQGRILAIVGVLLFLLVVFIVAAAVVLPRLISAPGLAALVTGEPVVEAPEPDIALSARVTQDDAGQRMVTGRALLEAGRPLESATPLYQALGLAPDVEELELLGYAACEAAAMQVLTDAIHREALGDTITSRTARDLARTAEKATDAELPQVRASIVEALLVLPEDSGLIRALGSVDSRLAGLAVVKVEAAGEEAVASDSWTLLEEALSLSPTSGVAAAAAWAQISDGREAAVPLLEKALLMEIEGQPEEASRLYASAAAHLPGQSDPLERLARARMDALAR